MKRCPKCNSEWEDKNKFCTKCGTSLPQPNFCTKCGTRLNVGVRFCTGCGARIENEIPKATLQNAQNETDQKIERSERWGQKGLQVQNTQPDIGIVQSDNGNLEDAHEAVKERNEEKQVPLTGNPGNSSEGFYPIGDYPQKSGSNKTTIWVIIIAIAIIMVGAVFWFYREGYIGSNGPVESEVPVKREAPKNEAGEEMTWENTAESTEQILGITGNDIVYLSGKIDAKYPVHMILDLRQRRGGYYYDKYGSSNFIGVDIPQLRSLGDGRWLITLSISTANGDVDEEWHGTLTYEKFTGNGLYLGKEMPFDLDVDSVITESKDPLIEKVHANGANWKSCVFDGDVTGGGKVFKVKITAQTNSKGEFKDANYHNLSYNVSFPVDVRINGEHLYISGKSGHSDFRIEATSQGDAYEGNIYADGKSLPITLGRAAL